MSPAAMYSLARATIARALARQVARHRLGGRRRRRRAPPAAACCDVWISSGPRIELRDRRVVRRPASSPGVDERELHDVHELLDVVEHHTPS
jgi:hypothetical protein